MTYDRKTLFGALRPTIGKGSLSQGQVDGIEVLVSEGEARGFNTEWIAYVLATAFWETDFTIQPIRETGASSDASAEAILEKAWKDGHLKVSTDYWSDGYFGRGYVQLTHKANYETMGKVLGIDLVGNPSLALEPAIAAKIIYEGMYAGSFTGKKLSTYLDGKIGNDIVEAGKYTRARQIVNGTDKASTIAAFALQFQKALQKADDGKVVAVVTTPVVLKPVEVVIPVEPTGPATTMDHAPPKQSPEPALVPTKVEPITPANSPHTSIWGSILALVTVIMGYLGGLNPIVQGFIILAVAILIFTVISTVLRGKVSIKGLF